MEAYTVIKYETDNYKIRKFPYFPINLAEINKNQPVKDLTEKEDFTPAEILSCRWRKWNEPDEILFKTKSGNIFLVSDENLLKEVSDFTKLKNHGKKHSLAVSYLHIKGREHFECYEEPGKAHILQFLKNRLDDYDIFTPNGEIVKKSECRMAGRTAVTGRNEFYSDILSKMLDKIMKNKNSNNKETENVQSYKKYPFGRF